MCMFEHHTNNAEFLEWLYPWTQHPGVVFVLPLVLCATTAESLTRHWASPHWWLHQFLIFELVYSSPSILLTHMMGESETYETMKKSLPNALPAKHALRNLLPLPPHPGFSWVSIEMILFFFELKGWCCSLCVIWSCSRVLWALVAQW